MQYIGRQKQIIIIWKNFDKNKESWYIHYWESNSLHGWATSQKFLVDGCKWKNNMLEFNKKDWIKNYDDDSDKGYILQVDLKYPKNLHDLHSDLPFLPERIKINKCNQLVCNIYDKKLCCSHKVFKTDIRSWTNIKESTWLKEYIDKNTELRKQAKRDFEKDFFTSMNN